MAHLASSVVGAFALGLVSLAVAQPTFHGIGFLAGTDSCQPLAISSDGSCVVGICRTFPQEAQAFLWTAEEGMLPLGGGSSFPVAISADNSTVVGYFASASTGSAYRWTKGTGFVPILGSGQGATVTGVSFDGSVIVGRFGVWTEQTGILPLLVDEGGPISISDDGIFVAGRGSQRNARYYGTSVGWLYEPAMPRMGTCTSICSLPIDVGTMSRNGRFIGGRDQCGRGAIWSNTARIELMPDCASSGDDAGPAEAISDDGTVVLARGGTMLWDARNGWRSLPCVMSAAGIDFQGWIVTSATAMSADGLSFTGYGTSPGGAFQAAGWIARLNEIPISADFNHDGFVSGDDVDLFRSLFEAGAQAADFNGDLFVNGDDFDAFVKSFTAGC